MLLLFHCSRWYYHLWDELAADNLVAH